ncbi:hypothetical protein V6N13_041126 [Hibiscus sabdariffa]
MDLGSISTGSSDFLDPARKYGKPKPTNKNSLVCNFCGKAFKGGAYRMKQHLIGGFKNMSKCPKCPNHVSEEVKAFMIKKIKVKEDDYDEKVHATCDKQLREKACRAIKLRKTKSPAEWWSLFGSSTPNLQMFAIKVFNNDTGCAGNHGGHFGLPRAIKLRKTKSPAEWWSMFGSSTPNLQMFAIEVFNYDTGCHRNHGLHTRKRHRVSQNHYLTTTSKIMKENSGLSSKFDKGKDVPTSSAPRSTRKVVDDDDEIEEDIGEDETYYFEYNEDDDEIEEDIGEDEIYYYEYNEDDDDDDLK